MWKLKERNRSGREFYSRCKLCEGRLICRNKKIGEKTDDNEMGIKIMKMIMMTMIMNKIKMILIYAVEIFLSVLQWYT